MKIKELLRKKHKTQKNLALYLGVSPSSVSQSINGNPSIGTIIKIANFLGVPAEELYDENIPEEKKLKDQWKQMRLDADKNVIAIALAGLRAMAELREKENTHIFLCPCCGAEIKITIEHERITEND